MARTHISVKEYCGSPLRNLIQGHGEHDDDADETERLSADADERVDDADGSHHAGDGGEQLTDNDGSTDRSGDPTR